MIDRRAFMVGLTSAAAAGTVTAQQSHKTLRVGLIAFANGELRTHLDQALIDGLRAKGYVEGVNLILERRYADGIGDRVGQFAKELAGMRLDAIVTTCTPTTRAMVSVPHRTPLVMAAVSDPVGQGLIASYARPGGNITGTASQFEDLAAKSFQLLQEVAPKSSAVAILLNPRNPIHGNFSSDINAAALLAGVKIVTVPIERQDDLAPAFDSMGRAGISSVMTLPDDSFLFNLRRAIVGAIEAARLPSIFGVREAVEDGGLMSYGESLGRSHRRVAHYLDRIFNGARPDELPVEQPTKFELVVNLKTAAALGITIPPSILIRADEVIE